MAAKGLSTTKCSLNWDRLRSIAVKEMESGDYNLGLYIIFSLYTGLRSKELLHLRLEDMYDGGRVVDHLMVWQTKTEKYRRITVAPGLKEILSQCDRRDGFILPGRSGQPMAKQWVNEKIKSLSSKYRVAGRSELSTHALRKTFARKIVDNNKGKEEWALVLLSDIFGHSSIATTRRYLGIRQEEMDMAYNSL